MLHACSLDALAETIIRRQCAGTTLERIAVEIQKLLAIPSVFLLVFGLDFGNAREGARIVSYRRCRRC